MRFQFYLLYIAVAFSGTAWCQDNSSQIISSKSLDQFFTSHPAYQKFRKLTDAMYLDRNNYFWFEGGNVSEFGMLVYESACRISEEGLPSEIPYKNEVQKIFQQNSYIKPQETDEIMLTCLYFYYTSKVFGGLSLDDSSRTGWNLPRQRQDYITWLIGGHSNYLVGKPSLFNQYYELKKGLQKYRKIEKEGGWATIRATKVHLKYNDSSDLLTEVKQRLSVEGYFEGDTSNNTFEEKLLESVKSYQEHNGMIATGIINDSFIAALNIPVAERIETISVNMERCRWISPESETNYLAVNIPSFHLLYFRNGEPVFTSNVVVGKEMNKTVVFSGILSQIIFNPYWNVPNSILNKEILPALKKNPGLLQQQRMEWYKGKLRQRPGKNNALGLVKFIFPNSNNIYLHDTPQKRLFKEEKRAFSHGCIRVEKACELAAILMNENFGWSESQTVEAMQSNKQKVYELKYKIPVYIAYFTAWSDKSGKVYFFNDIYKRDKKLAEMLFSKE